MKVTALLIALLALTPTMVSAQAYKCRTASGKVMISDDPCRDGATAENYIAAERGGSVTNSIMKPSAPIKTEESGTGAGKNSPSQAIPAYRPTHCVTVRSGRGGHAKCYGYRWTTEDAPAEMYEIGR